MLQRSLSALNQLLIMIVIRKSSREVNHSSYRLEMSLRPAANLKSPDNTLEIFSYV